ncbi:MAG TPA: GNAT family N-acetyltransferase, partial [Gaiellaceae bacterium]|nr:GNAT family N-acetyltransferase [Gaiellaceae bacterium]
MCVTTWAAGLDGCTRQARWRSRPSTARSGCPSCSRRGSPSRPPAGKGAKERHRLARRHEGVLHAARDVAAAEEWLRLVFLRLDGRPLAFQYCFEHDGALLWFKAPPGRAASATCRAAGDLSEVRESGGRVSRFENGLGRTEREAEPLTQAEPAGSAKLANCPEIRGEQDAAAADLI